MRMAHKSWLSLSLACLILAGCTTHDDGVIQAPPQPAYNGPVVEIPGIEPRYEPYIPSANQDYSRNGQRYTIVKDPSNFSQIGLAASYGEENRGNVTASGEQFNPEAMTAAHPTLPIPSYVRVTNLANGRRLVVRINDRGPYTPGRIIDLSTAAANRLNLTQHTKVRIDFINVAPDGTLSGPGTIGTRVAKQSYALPARPQIGMAEPALSVAASAPSAASSAPAPEPVSQPAGATIGNPTPASLAANHEHDSMPLSAPASHSGGFLGAPQPLRSGVLEEQPPAATPATVNPSSAAAAVSGAIGGHYLVQVGAVSSHTRAQQWQQQLSQRFAVPGKVEANGAIFRVQLGPFATRSEASALQHRLSSEAGQQSFITNAP
ncbi:endolytic peptidoglycan transglycosylase RlpA [Edwardsiella hoshinae]|uniref:Endolytic peptidoglycan transglycosylase RlpA n=1 Tax=Edwardsiella hoshinae TaxID=93378 RepID=A0A376D9T2_9GAMM|nr:endolytic peptidoglycan transglycosylase RlpA [Edwardsiella hoshinae]QPR27919.1 endolytic peptidoglycan transglycosylase RlpA [Edwardsiella hoshinae]STC85566.1 Rare lipoprotein A precursor [Edwardsiella hoshinae]